MKIVNVMGKMDDFVVCDEEALWEQVQSERVWHAGTQTRASVSSESVSVVNISGNEIDGVYSRLLEYEKHLS